MENFYPERSKIKNCSIMYNKRVLIVKLNKLGDTIAFFPTIEAIRKNYPHSHLTLLTTDIGREVIEGSKLVDTIWTSTIDDIRTLRGFSRWLKIVRKNRFDIAIASNDSSSFVALLFFISAIPVRIGFANPKLSFLFTHKIPFSDDISHAELNLLIAKHLGFSIDYSRPTISISEQDKKDVLDLLNEHGIKELDRFIVIHLGSDRLTLLQRWPLERFVDVVTYLSRKYSTKIICVGAVKEKEIVLLMYKYLHKDWFIDMVGKTNIKQLIYLISIANLFIGHPSGPLQIAYIVGTPSVSLWGASSLVDWGPIWNKEKHICIQANLDCIGCEQTKCSKGTFECMNLITVDRVIKEISKLLNKGASLRL